MGDFIPVCEPLMEGNEKKYVNEALDTNWISSAGGFIDKFEEGFAKYSDSKYGISTTSGTTALHLALLALGVGPGDEVILPNFTMAASMFSILYCGAKPVFVDVDEGTWNIDSSQIESKITDKTKAIMVVHLFGIPVEMKPVWDLSKKHNIPIIEDAAQSHGALYDGKKVGSLGDISCFSFFANKIITTGEGGMVLTSSDELADKCRYYKNLCFPLRGPRNYMHDDLGHNYRLTNIQAAIGLAQLEKIDYYIERRVKMAEFYTKGLSSCKELTLQKHTPNAKNICWMYSLALKSKDRDEVISKLKDKGIGTRILFKPMNIQGAYKKAGYKDDSRYPVTEYLSEKGFYIPSGSGLNEEQLKRIVSAVLEVVDS